MTTKAICMVKGIRLQKPSPKALAVACGVEPKPIAASATMTTPSTANTYASGNHFSAQAAERSAARPIQPSCTAAVEAIAYPPRFDGSILGGGVRAVSHLLAAGGGVGFATPIPGLASPPGPQ